MLSIVQRLTLIGLDELLADEDELGLPIESLFQSAIGR